MNPSMFAVAPIDIAATTADFVLWAAAAATSGLLVFGVIKGVKAIKKAWTAGSGV